MIDSNNIDVIRTNIRTLNEKVLESNGNIDTIIEVISDLEDDIESIENTIGTTPLPTGQTITSALPHYVDVTRNTNDNGYLLFTASETPVDKVISCQVLEPSRQVCELWVNTVSDDHYIGYVHTRGIYDTKLVSTQCKVRLWMTN